MATPPSRLNSLHRWLLILDVDGTITLPGRGHELDLELAAMLREVESRGLAHVMLVSGTALPILAGVAVYLGLKGPHVAENGCVAFSEGQIIPLCRTSVRDAAQLVERELSSMVKPVWHNVYRHFDFAFRVRPGVDPAQAVKATRKLLERYGYDYVKVSYSGFAVHLRPVEASKGKAVAELVQRLGLKGELIAVGDSDIDLEFRDCGARLFAVANASPALARQADTILPRPASEGVKMLLESLLHE